MIDIVKQKIYVLKKKDFAKLTSNSLGKVKASDLDPKDLLKQQ